MELHDIGWAVLKVRVGQKVYRRGWNGRNQYIALIDPFSKDHGMQDGMTLPFVYIKTVDDEFVPWLCSQTDLLAEDWELVES